jgi:uncharacterized protein (DUF488 family)
MASTVFTVGHGTRTSEELIDTLSRAGVRTLVDVRRYPGSRRNPQFNQDTLARELAASGIEYRHELELGGRRSGEPDEEAFACLRVPAFRSYAARMRRPDWQEALARALSQPTPCFLCAETPWQRCHPRLIAELLTAHGRDVLHLLGPHELEPHRLYDEADLRDGKLYLCGSLVA